jgi:hypothetical protein
VVDFVINDAFGKVYGGLIDKVNDETKDGLFD